MLKGISVMAEFRTNKPLVSIYKSLLEQPLMPQHPGTERLISGVSELVSTVQCMTGVHSMLWHSIRGGIEIFEVVSCLGDWR